MANQLHNGKAGVRISTLCENTSPIGSSMMAEHGLCMLVEVDNQAFLLDTGQTSSIIHNAQILDIDLKCVNTVILSHGHFDHTGGLKHLLHCVKQVQVVAHPDVQLPRYLIRADKPALPIGLPFTLDELENSGASFEFSSSPTELSPRVLATGQIPRVTAYEEGDKDLCLNINGDWVQDPIWDDQALIIKTDLGLVVALGCAHSGIINTLSYAQQITGEDRIYAVLGGTHLGPASPEQLVETIGALEALNIQKLGVSHCTGPDASAVLADIFGDRFFYNNAGTVIDL